MSYGLNLKIPKTLLQPVVEPVTLAEAKGWMKIDNDADDEIITSLIKAARQAAEKYTRRAFITQTLTLSLDKFPFRDGASDLPAGVYQLPYWYLDGQEEPIFLPRAPLQSVTSITCYFLDNTSVVVDPSVYHVDIDVARIVRNSGEVWPTNLRCHNAVVVEYVAGYGLASSVPEAIKIALNMHVLRMYEMRNVCDMPPDCKAMLDVYRIMDRLVSYG